MEPEEFEAKMADIFADPETHSEEKFIQSNELIREVLCDFGYESGMEVYQHSKELYMRKIQ